MPTGMKGWLKIDASHRRVLNRKIDDLPDLVLVYAALDCRNQGDGETDLSQAVQGTQLYL